MEALATPTERSDATFLHGVQQGLVVFRWLAITYAAIGVVVSDEHLSRPLAAAALLSAAVAVTVVTTVLFRQAPAMLTSPVIVGAEFVVGVALLIGDGLVYEATRPQSLPWAWPAASLIAAAVAFGPRIGVVAALAMGAASFVGEGLVSDVDAGWGVTASSKTGLYVLAAAVAGFVADRLRRAEREVSTARAREEIARTLHDGVLQTLAVVQRRSDDAALVTMAREQDQELRAFLFGTGATRGTRGSGGSGGLGPHETREVPTLATALRDAAARTERHHGVVTAAVIADDLPDLAPGHVDAIAGAVGEALTNAAKHAEAARIVVFAEPDDDGGIFCSVKDDGVGFDLDTPNDGQGIARSIRARMHEVGGTAEISSRPGSGTEVRLRVPAPSTTRGRR